MTSQFVVDIFLSTTWCASAYNEDDLAGESRSRLSFGRTRIHGAYDAITLTTSVPITSIDCTSK